MREKMASSSSSSLSSSSCLLLFSSLGILTQSLAVRSQQNPLKHFCLNDRGNFTANSSYASNLNLLVSSFSSISQFDGGFYNISLGETNKVNSILMCRGDIKPADCITCIDTAGKDITERCPNQKEAIIWYVNCTVRYSNRTILNQIETRPHYTLWNPNNYTADRESWEKTLRDLMESLRSKAAAGGAQKKFAVGNMSAPAFQTMFGLVQCTPDLSSKDCTDCLTQIFGNIPTCCDGKRGGRWLTPSCNFRYEIYPFYEPTSPPLPPPPLSPANETRKAKEGTPPLPPANETRKAGEGTTLYS